MTIECVPVEAFEETIHHEAVGEETVTVSNPDFVPAIPEQTVTSTVKWNWTGGPVDHVPAAPGGTDDYGWHLVGPTNDSKAGESGVVHTGNGKASFFYFEDVVTTVPAVPAQGDEFVSVPNPEFVAAWDEAVSHEGVECEVPVEPPVVDVPVDAPVDEVPIEVVPVEPTVIPDTPAIEATETITSAPVAPQAIETGITDPVPVWDYTGAALLVAVAVASMLPMVRRWVA